MQTFAPPGPGTWQQDSTHCPRPLTPYFFELFKDAFPKGVKEGTARYGLLFSHMEPALVNGFVYYRHTMVDFDDKQEVGRRFEAARSAFESKIWLKDLDWWDREYKPDSIRRNRELEAVPADRLDTEGLIAHLAAARENAREMIYRHHIFTVSSIIPVGRYLANASEWTGLDAGVVLAPLKGSSQVSLGAHEELLQVGAALNELALGSKDFSGLSPQETLDALQKHNPRLGNAVRNYVQAIGLRLASGYDVADPCVIELPEVLLKSIWASKEHSTRAVSKEDLTAKVRDAVPDRYRKQFDEMLDDVLRTNRLRDERGIYNDIWGTGIARRALLEAGRRLAAKGRIDEPENIVDAMHDEQISMLRDGSGPSRDELRSRTERRRNASLNDVPPLLGPPPSPPPPLDGLPPYVIEGMRAMGAAMGEVLVQGPVQKDTMIAGKPVSSGVYTGTARVINHPGDFNRLVKGDVLVTIATSAAFNVVLPLLGAIVTDRGGQLSHAAIVAREYGIPAVVGTLKATSVIPDGARIKVDGATGRVEIVASRRGGV
ncbi:MAG: hypothetical protein HY646_09040 [Acidobacteria bacterium]|nr:hypothetical protein [Acidobacteriota bacterium]